MYPSAVVLSVGVFVAGWISARYDLPLRLYELALFAWYHDVLVRSVYGFAGLSLFFVAFAGPVAFLAVKETNKHPRSAEGGLSAREQLRRRGSF